MKIVAIVPIKMNNQRLPGKNTKMLGNKPLIQYILNTLKQVKEIDDIYVYCSNEEIKRYIKNDVKFLKRSEELDRDTTNFTQIFEAFSEKIDADIYVYTHATAPFISKETIEDCITRVVRNGHDSAFTAEKIQDFLWMNNKPVNFDQSNIPRSQDLPLVYRETSGAYVFKKDMFEKYKSRVGMTPYIKEVFGKEKIDINYQEDFDLAEKILKEEY